MDISMDEIERIINDPRAISKLLLALAEERERRQIAEEELHAINPYYS